MINVGHESGRTGAVVRVVLVVVPTLGVDDALGVTRGEPLGVDNALGVTHGDAAIGASGAIAAAVRGIPDPYA
jgi:hypothetical protein